MNMFGEIICHSCPVPVHTSQWIPFEALEESVAVAGFIADIRSSNMSPDIEMSDSTSSPQLNAAPQVEQFHGHTEIHGDRWGIILSYKHIQSYPPYISSGMSRHSSAGGLEQQEALDLTQSWSSSP